MEIMKKLFEYLAVYFDKIPFLNKVKGLRSMIGFAGLGVVAGLKAYGVGDAELLSTLQYGFMVWTGLSLNAKGRG